MVSRQERCCVTVGYGRNALASVASSDATHDGGRPTFDKREMLHHFGLGKKG